jgi:hypothetical protein
MTTGIIRLALAVALGVARSCSHLLRRWPSRPRKGQSVKAGKRAKGVRVKL